MIFTLTPRSVITGDNRAVVINAIRFVKGVGRPLATRLADGETVTFATDERGTALLRGLSAAVTALVSVKEHATSSESTASTANTSTTGGNMIDTATAATGLAKVLEDVLKGAVDEERVRAIVNSAIDKRFEAIPSVTIKVERSTGEVKEIEGFHHPLMPKLLRICTARKPDGSRLNVWLTGPTASGKTTAARLVANALDLPLYIHGAVDMDFKLIGFVDASGTYHMTGFVKAFLHGGVVLLDEVDSYEPSPVLAVQAALANGEFMLPNGEMIKRHPDCIVIAAGNTWGSGATAEFVGRNKLDAAFLSRFACKLFWHRDPALELNIAGNEAWVRRVQSARARAERAGLKHTIDPRHSIDGAALIGAGFTPDEVADMTYLAGLSAEQRKIVEGV